MKNARTLTLALALLTISAIAYAAPPPAAGPSPLTSAKLATILGGSPPSGSCAASPWALSLSAAGQPGGTLKPIDSAATRRKSGTASECAVGSFCCICANTGDCTACCICDGDGHVGGCTRQCSGGF